MMEHISTNKLDTYISTISDINGRVFFASHHYEYKNERWSTDDIKYHSVYDIYEFYPDKGTTKLIAQVTSLAGYPRVIGTR